MHVVTNTPAGPMEAVRSYSSISGGLPHLNGGSASALGVSRPARCLLALQPTCSRSRLNGSLHRRLRRLRCLCHRFDCYRVERTSSRAGLYPAEKHRLSRRTFRGSLELRLYRRAGVQKYPANGLLRAVRLALRVPVAEIAKKMGGWMERCLQGIMGLSGTLGADKPNETRTEGGRVPSLFSCGHLRGACAQKRRALQKRGARFVITVCVGKDGIVMQVETQLSDQIARYLDMATTETKLTAANMADVDTPGSGRWGWTSRPRCGRR